MSHTLAGSKKSVVVGLRALVAQVDAGINSEVLLGEDELGAVLGEQGRVDDFRVVVRSRACCAWCSSR